MKSGRHLFAISFLFIAFTSCLCSGTEETVTQEVRDIVEYKGFGHIVNSDKQNFRKILETIGQLPAKEQIIATYNCLRSIYASLNPVKDRHEKLVLLLQWFQKNRSILDSKIRPYLALCIGSNEEEDIREQALELLLANSEMNMSAIDDNGILILNIDTNKKKKINLGGK